MSEAPTLDYERRFRGSGALRLARIEAVGRVALAGPDSVGIADEDRHKQKLLADVRDTTRSFTGPKIGLSDVFVRET